MRANIMRKLKEKKGFTLIEMIIVIAIIAILIALIAPNMMKFLDTANTTKANAAAKTLYTSAQTYMTERYVAGDPFEGTGFGKGTAPAGFETEYFNADELKRITGYTISVSKGVVTSVDVTMDGKTASYPQKPSSTPPVTE